MKRTIETLVTAKKPREPKKKVALLMGFCGTKYQGMQVNPGTKTIEADLFKSLIKIGAVSEENSECLQKIKFQRSCRTDKGVHAAGQVVSLKMILHSDSLEKLNRELPDDIRVYSIRKVISSFNAKNNCDSRIYEYLMPSFVLKYSPLPKTEPMQESQEANEEEFDEQYLEACRNYRVSEEQLSQLNNILNQYVGSKMYHNFTINKKEGDDSCRRYIKSFKVIKKMDVKGQEWIVMQVHGQSFMMHQIRKMVGLAILLFKTGNENRPISEFFKASMINIPKAPGIGLLLERALFDNYNKKWNDRDQIEFDNAQLKALKEELIYPQIFNNQLKLPFQNWLRCLDRHSYEYSYMEIKNSAK